MKKYKLMIFLLVLFFCGFVGIVQAGLNDGLVAYYPFNGNAEDESGNGNHGVVMGATLTEDRFGKTNSAYSFDGENDYINLSPSVLGNWTEITYSVWVKAPKYTGSGWPSFIGTDIGVSGENPYNTAIGIQRSTERLWIELTTDVANYPMIGTIPIPWGEWFHAVMVYDGQKLKEYINGEAGNEIDATGTLRDVISLDIGKCVGYYEDIQFYNGEIDSVRIYNRALSESEIQELYHEDEACEERYDEGYQSGRQACIDDPASCGIFSNGEYTQDDLDASYDEGYQAGLNANCENSSLTVDSNCATFDLFTNTLNVPCLNMGQIYWVDLKLAGDYLTIEGFGEVE